MTAGVLKPGLLTMLIGRPSRGKSQHSKDLLAQMKMDGYRVLYASTEHPDGTVETTVFGAEPAAPVVPRPYRRSRLSPLAAWTRRRR